MRLIKKCTYNDLVIEQHLLNFRNVKVLFLDITSHLLQKCIVMLTLARGPTSRMLSGGFYPHVPSDRNPTDMRHEVRTSRQRRNFKNLSASVFDKTPVNQLLSKQLLQKLNVKPR
jgi:hypothetical protein